MKLKTHKELADYIAGKRILLMNSLGKDSVLCLEWLTKFACPSEVISMTYKLFAEHPGDAPYLKYLKRRYPDVQFREFISPLDVSRTLLGVYQSPIATLKAWNHAEFDSFDQEKVSEDLRISFGCDFICYGMSRYESFDRANYFHKQGLLDPPAIFPLGMMSKKQVLGLINFKLHPIYKLNKSTLDKPNYYKMRSSFLVSPQYKRAMLNAFPLLELDEYRWERMMR